LNSSGLQATGTEPAGHVKISSVTDPKNLKISKRVYQEVCDAQAKASEMADTTVSGGDLAHMRALRATVDGDLSAKGEEAEWDAWTDRAPRNEMPEGWSEKYLDDYAGANLHVGTGGHH
jgi:hypothetical protein